MKGQSQLCGCPFPFNGSGCPFLESDYLMPYIKTKIPEPNMNNEFIFSVTPTSDKKLSIYDFSQLLPPYNGRGRDNRLKNVSHEIHGKTQTVYIVDRDKVLTRKQAIKLAKRFIDGDFDTYRLD